MIRSCRLSRSACLFFAACVISANAQTKTTTPKTLTQEFQQTLHGAERASLTLANGMPEDRYNFVPTNGEFKDVRSFALLVRHIAVANYENGASLLGEKLPIDPGEHENGSDSLQTKAQIMKFLRDSFIYLHKGMARINDKNYMEVIDYPGGARVSRMSVAVSGFMHPWDIYGQMIEYLRMNGIDPQNLQLVEQ